jgi:hypothetical protein
VPEVKNLGYALILVDLVVNQDWALQQFANPQPFSDDGTHARKAGE